MSQEIRIQRVARSIIKAQTVSDGAGVKIRRSLGLQQHLRLDPFLMLDCFGSDEAADYIAGFPPHPHRGFETVTYMLAGHMLHEDHLGNKGHLKSGGVQWMTAGRGIIHSEMPQQQSGLMQGFQLWLNLPAAEKMKAAAYVDLTPEQIPKVSLGGNSWVKVIAGDFISDDNCTIKGPVQGLSTAPLYLDFCLNAGDEVSFALPLGHNALVYPFVGDILIGHQQPAIPSHQAAVLSDGNQLTLTANSAVRLLVLAAKPIGEPIVQYGPFVMNTVAEIEQAISDYQAGTLTDGAAATLNFS